MHDWIVKFNLQTVPGVTEVLGIGGHEKQYEVEVSPEALLRYDLTLREVIERIEANNLNIGAQFIVRQNEELVVRSIGLASSLEDLTRIVVKSHAGRSLYLGDVATVRLGGAIRRGLQSAGGQGEVVAGMVIKLFGTNSSKVIEAVELKISEINRALPAGVSIVPYYQQKELVTAAVATVTTALREGIILVMVVLLLFMGGLRPSLVVAIAVPFSVLFAAIAMWYLGITANLMSLGGLAIAIGMLVDGAIVMVENVDRRLRLAPPGESVPHTVALACQEVGRPILFATTIVIVVFLPLFTLQGVEGKTFRPLAMAVALAMLGALLFAMILAPVYASLVMRRPKTTAALATPSWVERWLVPPYRWVLTRLVRQRWLALTLAGILLLAGIWVYPRLGAEFTPRLNEGTIVVRLTMAPSIGMAESLRNVTLVEKRLLTLPEVVQVTSRVGRGEVGAHADPINSAEMFVVLAPKEQWQRPGDQGWVEERLRALVADLPGIQANLSQPIEMSVDELLEGVKAELAIKLFGDEITTLVSKGDELAALLAEIPGAEDVQVDQMTGAPQLLIKPDRQAVARAGLNLVEVQEVIRAAVGGVAAGEVFEGVRRFPIQVRYPEADRDSREAIGRLLIPTPEGARIPLSQLAVISEVIGSRQISRENSQRFITIQCNVVGRDIVSFVAEAKARLAAELTLPPGYLTSWGGQFRLQQEANKRLAVVVPVALLIVLLLLYGSFHSLMNALLIMLNIPLALVGGLFGLWLSGQNLSVPASVGFIALFGIALGNGMVLVTQLNQLRAAGGALDDISVTGACQRLRAVLMTALTTALGLLPLLFASGTGSEVQRPLATVVIGGLLTSTVLTLLVVPALYKWFTAKPELDI
jgi:heavy metal efflux system protein